MHCPRDAKLVTINNTSTNAVDHIRRLHPAIYRDVLAPAIESYEKARQAEAELHAMRRSTNQATQVSIESMCQARALPVKKYEKAHERQRVLSKKIALMVARDFLPFDIVEKAGFCDLMDAAEARYTVYVMNI